MALLLIANFIVSKMRSHPKQGNPTFALSNLIFLAVMRCKSTFALEECRFDPISDQVLDWS